jgi:hypothetical protein
MTTPVSMKKLPCVVCGKKLKNLLSTGAQPNDGLEFVSYGHYGSTVFDPMDGTFLALAICDPCLLKARKQRRMLHCKQERRPLTSVTIWKARA